MHVSDILQIFNFERSRWFSVLALVLSCKSVAFIKDKNIKKKNDITNMLVGFFIAAIQSDKQKRILIRI